MTTNQNGGDKHPEAAMPLSPSQQLMEKLKAYENMYGSLDDHYSLGTGPSPFSPLSDMQTLESNFRRLGVADSNARQQPLLDHGRSNQFALNGRDRGINLPDYNPYLRDYNPYFQPQSEPEQANLAQRLWFGKDNRVNGYDAYKSSNYASYGGSTSGLSIRHPYGNYVPSHPSNHNFYEPSPWSFSNGYVLGTNDPFTMNNSRATNTTLSRAKDLVESSKLQSMIAEGSRETIDKIFGELISHVCELMTDSLGHQVFQKLLEKCTDEQITRVLDVVIQQPIRFVRLCDNSYGTRAVQDLIRSLGSEDKISRFMVTLCHVALLLTKSTNTSNVIIFCFGHFSLSQTNCLLRVIVQNCYQVAIDQYGCCMLQQCIGKFSREIKDPLVREIITNSLSLSVNCYGNYAVQYVLELENYQVGHVLSRYLDGNYVQLSSDKYGSHVVQKCLRSRQFNSKRIIQELLSDIDSLLVHPFGNYVMYTAWVVSQDDMQSELLYHINKNHLLMSCNTYGKKLLQKLKLWV